MRTSRRLRSVPSRRWPLRLKSLEDRAVPATLLSVSAVSPPDSPNGDSISVGLSTDGRFALIRSAATNLVAGQVDLIPFVDDVFLRDRLTGTTTLVSHAPGAPTTAASGFDAALSADGRYVAFASGGVLVPGQTGSQNNLFLYDRVSDTSALVTHAAGSPTAAASGPVGTATAAFSADGRYVAYMSLATDLVAGQVDSPNTWDVFLYDRETGTNILVSHAVGSAISAADGQADSFTQLAISGDGRYVVYESQAANLVVGQVDSPATFNLFVYDRVSGTSALIDHAAGSATAVANAAMPQTSTAAVSGDGRYVQFASVATDLVAGQIDANGLVDVFLYDTLAGTNVLVSHAAGAPTTAANFASAGDGVLSDDGRFLTFGSRATNLFVGQLDTNNLSDLFQYDRVSDTTILVSHAAGLTTTAANGASVLPAMSGDGRFVAYASGATNLVIGQIDMNGGGPDIAADVFLFDRQTSTTTLVSHAAGAPVKGGDGMSGAEVFVSAGGYVAFSSTAANLTTSPDANGLADAFIGLTPTATDLTSTPNPALAGTPVTFTATVTLPPPGSGTPTGFVNFYGGIGASRVLFGTAPLSGGTAQLTFPLPAGRTIVTAVYTGDGAGATGGASVDQVMSVHAIRAVAAGAGPGGAPLARLYAADGTLRRQLTAYDPSFTGGVRVAAGDVTGDEIDDIVTGPGEGGGPHVKVYDGATGLIVREFLAYDAAFRGGVWVAIGDVTGDGRGDVITGAGTGGGPHVKVFDGVTGNLVREFLAYDSAFRGGVTVAAGELTGDTLADVVTGAGTGGGPHVKVFDSATGAVARHFFAYDSSFRGGVFVAVGDVTGLGRNDIVTGTGTGGGPHVRVFNGVTGNLVREFFAYFTTFFGGVRVAAGDTNGDGVVDIVTGPGPGGGPHVKEFDGATGLLIREFFPFDASTRGGVYVG